MTPAAGGARAATAGNSRSSSRCGAPTASVRKPARPCRAFPYAGGRCKPHLHKYGPVTEASA